MADQQIKFIFTATGDTQVAGAANRTGAALDKLTGSQDKVGMSAAAMANAMRMVPAQLTDITVGLATGQAPLTVLLQQGGQLKDMFGGIGPAARGVASAVVGLLSPVTVLAAGLGAVAYAAYEGAAESSQLTKSLAISGGFAGVTAGQFDAMAKSITASTGASIGSTRELAAAAVATGAFGAQSIGTVVSAMARLQSFTGASADSIVKDFAGMTGGVAAWAAEHNRSYHFLSVEQFAYIQRLERQHQTEQAMAVTAQALDQALAARKPQLGYLEQAWASLGKTASAAWDAMKGVGRAETVDSQIAKLQAAIQANAQRTDRANSIGPNGLREGGDAQAARLREQLAYLQEQKRMLERAATAQSDREQKDAAGIAALTDTGAMQRAMQTQLATLAEQLKAKQDAYKNSEATIARDLRDGVLTEADAIRQRGALQLKQIGDEQASLVERLAILKKYPETEQQVAAARGEIGRLAAQAALANSRIELDAQSAARDEAAKHAKAYIELWTQAEMVSQRLAEQTATGMAKLITDPLARARAEAEISVQALQRSNEQLQKNLQTAIDQAGFRGDTGAAGLLQRQLDGLKTNQASAAGGIRTGANQSYIDELLKANNTGTNFGAGFDAASQSLGTFTQKFGDLLRMQAEYTKGLTAQGMTEQQLAQLRNGQAQMQVRAYGDITGAAKGFFDKGTKGYKALENAEKVFRAFELAMAVKAALVKAGLIEGVTVAKVAGDSVQATSATAAAGVEVAASMTAGTAAAAAGVANQASGDPYSAFPRMAAMAAIMAALGFATGMFGGGGGNGNFAPTNSGTGTVLGDATKQSESIAKSIELLHDVDTMTMRYSAQMAASLLSIESNIGGLTSLLVQSGNLGSASAGVNTNFQMNALGRQINNFGQLMNGSLLTKGLSNLPVVGSYIGQMGGALDALTNKVGGLFGSKSSVVGQGIYAAGQTLGSIGASGLDASYYADVLTKNKFFGITTGTSSSTQYTAADVELERQLGLVLNGFAGAVQAAAVPLGVNLDAVKTKLNSFVVDLGRIDLQGLTGDQINEKLTAVFSAAGDNIAKAALGGFEDFQKVGEGYLQTVLRVGSGSEQARMLLDRLNVSMVSLAAVTNKQGDAAAELVRQSLVAAETTTTTAQSLASGFFAQVAGRIGVSDRWVTTVVSTVSGIGDIISTLDGSAEDLASAYKALTDVRLSLQLLGLSGEAVTRSLIAGAGSLDSLQKGLSDYESNFFSDSEQLAIKTGRLREQFSQLGLALPSSRAAFRSLVAGIDTSTEAGQKLLGGLLPLSSAFADITDAVQQAGQGIQDEIDRLRGLTSADTAASNYAALQARFALTTAQARAGDSTALNNLPGLSKSLSDAVANVATDRLDQARQFAAIANSLEQTLAMSQGQAPGGAVSAGLVDAGVFGAGTSAAVAASTTASDQADLLAQTKDLLAEMKALRSEQNTNTTAIATQSAALLRLWQRLAPDGDAVQSRIVV